MFEGVQHSGTGSLIPSVAACRAPLDPALRGYLPAHTTTAESEAERWRAFLVEDLPKRVTAAQRKVLLQAWNKMACEATLIGLRYPIAENGPDGYAFTWHYRDIQGMLSIEVEPDGTLLWFVQKGPGDDVAHFDWGLAAPLPGVVLEMARRFSRG
jgi:hypothetical protein